jgi:hypothetical protein
VFFIDPLRASRPGCNELRLAVGPPCSRGHPASADSLSRVFVIKARPYAPHEAIGGSDSQKTAPLVLQSAWTECEEKDPSTTPAVALPPWSPATNQRVPGRTSLLRSVCFTYRGLRDKLVGISK